MGTEYTGRVSQCGPSGSWSYFVYGPGGFVHQPSKGWRSKGMAEAALRRSLKRYHEKVSCV